MKTLAIALCVCLATCLASPAPAAAHRKIQKKTFEPKDRGSLDERKSKSSHNNIDDGDSDCPPDWMRKTSSSGVQIGTGQPDAVLPIGCFENTFDRGPPIGMRGQKRRKRQTID